MIDQLKIGPVTYRVVETGDLHDVREDGRKQLLHGEIQWSSATIRVEANQTDDRKVTTLWHEAVHGILEAAGHGDHDENLVAALGFGLVQLVRDNPDLIRLTVGE